MQKHPRKICAFYREGSLLHFPVAVGRKVSCFVVGEVSCFVCRFVCRVHLASWIVVGRRVRGRVRFAGEKVRVYAVVVLVADKVAVQWGVVGMLAVLGRPFDSMYASHSL